MISLDGSVQKTTDGGFVVAFDRSIDRPPARVWTALTDPKVLANWLGDVELELRIGGAYLIRFRKISVVMTGTITALEPGQLLEYTWKENYGMPASKVRWEVVPADSGCRLTCAFPRDSRLRICPLRNVNQLWQVIDLFGVNRNGCAGGAFANFSMRQLFLVFVQLRRIPRLVWGRRREVSAKYGESSYNARNDRQTNLRGQHWRHRSFHGSTS